MSQVQRRRVARGISLVMMIAYTIAVVWLHYQQLCATGGGDDPYPSDLGLHLGYAKEGMIYSTALLLVGQAYKLGGRLGIAILLTLFHLMAIAFFAYGLRRAVPKLSGEMCTIVGLFIYFSQAVWIPRGGQWYTGTITGTLYHNTTYIMMAPFALLAVFMFHRSWSNIDRKLDLGNWIVYTVILTLATSFKANFVFAFAPTLLFLLIFDLIRTHGRNLKNEIVMGCSVLPSIALCLLQANVLFADPDGGLHLIFTVDFDPNRMSWGIFNQSSILGMLRSFVFVASVGILFKKDVWKKFRYKFSLLLLFVAMMEALLLVESGFRLYHGNLWWGPFICYWIFLLESASVFITKCLEWRAGERSEKISIKLGICSFALLWHVISGVYYFVRLMEGSNYGFPIQTYHLWFL